MSHPSQHNAIGAAPRELSTRSALAGFAGTLDSLDERLRDTIQTHWNPPQEGSKLTSTGSPPQDVTHTGWIAHIEQTLRSISDRIEFISARL